MVHDLNMYIIDHVRESNYKQLKEQIFNLIDEINNIHQDY